MCGRHRADADAVQPAWVATQTSAPPAAYQTVQDERRRITTIDNRTYLDTSWIFGDKDAGYGNSNEYIGGLNVYLAHSRNYRINTQVNWVNRSPVSSTFGYYVGGQKGPIVSAALSVFF
jgi:hypothetical protein